MNANLSIWISPDNSHAKLTIISSKATKEDVKSLIKEKKILEEMVLWDAVEQGLEMVEITGKPISDILVAQSNQKRTILFCQKEYTEKQFLSLRASLKSIGIAITEKKEGVTTEGYFVINSEQLLLEKFDSSETDILGNIVGATTHKPLIKTTSSIMVIKSDENESISYVAQKEGYVAITSEGELTIYDPLSVEGDNEEMFFYYLPVLHGEKLFSSFIEETLDADEKIHCIHHPSSINTQKRESTNIHIRSRRVPEVGADAELTITIRDKSKPFVEKDGTICYKDISPYTEVQEGTVIAQKRSAIAGIVGYDVLGHSITAPESKDIPFEAGKNIVTTQEEGIIFYKAATTGIVQLTTNGVSLEEELHIQGDVGTKTGNLYYSKDITIDGSITSGFTVKSEGNITVAKSIENETIVHCHNNLTVGKGVFGDKSDITVQKDATVGFLQDAKIRVGGSLTVRRYIYDSSVFCGKQLKVLGEGLSSKNRGAVLGGTVVALDSMDLISVGCSGAVTTLYSGVDPEVQDLIKVVEAKITVLNRKVIGYRNKIPVDLTDPQSKELLKHLSTEQKRTLKKSLLQLKEVTAQINSFQKTVADLKKRLEEASSYDSYIMIRNHAVPVIEVTVKDKKVKITENRENVTISES